MSSRLTDLGAMTRRAMLLRSGAGLGAAALARLADDRDAGPHFAPRAKSVVYIHLVGAPSHLDLFAPKPELQRRTGELCPAEFIEGKQLAFIRNHPRLLGTPADAKYRFRRCGSSGLPISNLLPHLQVAVARAGESVSNFFVDLGLTGPHATPSFATTGAPSALRAEGDADEPPPPPPEGFVGVYVPPATEAPPRYSTGGSSGAVEAAAAVEAELSPPSAANTRPTTPDKV